MLDMFISILILLICEFQKYLESLPLTSKKYTLILNPILKFVIV